MKAIGIETEHLYMSLLAPYYARDIQYRKESFCNTIDCGAMCVGWILLVSLFRVCSIGEGDCRYFKAVFKGCLSDVVFPSL